ncbi:unnamed protein product, partial [Polarella glacialis]
NRGPLPGCFSVSVVNPYCRCTVAGRSERSKTVADCPSPEWKQAWEFPLRSNDLRGEVLVEIFDETPGEHSFLGKARVPVSVVLASSGKVALTQVLEWTIGQGSVDLEMELLSYVDFQGSASLSDDVVSPSEELDDPEGEVEWLVQVGCQAALDVFRPLTA